MILAKVMKGMKKKIKRNFSIEVKFSRILRELASTEKILPRWDKMRFINSFSKALALRS
jgi:hypothetical protein